MSFIYPVILVFLVACQNKQQINRNLEEVNNGNSVKDDNEYYPANTSQLEDRAQTLELMYVSWFCPCANWITENEYKRYKDTGILSDQTFFVEPASQDLTIPDTIGYAGDLVKFTGQFYSEKGYPKNLVKSDEMPIKRAKVFRYTNYKILRSNKMVYLLNE